MSSRLRRLARRVKLTHEPEQSDAAAKLHGCASCRDPANRQALTKSLVESGDINGAKARCPLCGADWFVSFFADGSGQACVRFAVVAREVPS